MHTKRRLLMIGGTALAALLIATLVLVASGLHDDGQKADLALVLGNKVELGGTPSPRLRARLDKTIELYNAGYFPKIIASGGVGREGFDEGTVMRDYLVAHGVPEDRVIVDSLGVTTFESARKTAEIMREQRLRSVFVVSQYFHLPRTRLALRKFGVAEVYSAHARFFEIRDLYSLPRELAGYVSYWFRRYPVEVVSPLRG